MTAEQALSIVERAVFVSGAMPDECRALDVLRALVTQSRTTVRALRVADPGLTGNLADVLDGIRSGVRT